MIYCEQCVEISIQSDTNIIVDLCVRQNCFITRTAHSYITDMYYFPPGFFQQASRGVWNTLVKQELTHAASKATISSSRLCAAHSRA